MNLEDMIRELAPGLQLMSVATVTPTGAPWVRYVAGTMAPDLTLRFSTHISSRKVAQLLDNPQVHVTLGATDFKATEWLQVEGKAEITTSKEEREAFWFDGLKAYVNGIDDPDYAVVRIRPSRIELASMNAEPQVWTVGF